MRLDKDIRLEIAQVVNDAVRQALEAEHERMDERWISSAELCDRFQMFSPTWLKSNGHLLPRTQIVMIDSEGNEHRSKQWTYPQRKIARLIAEGRLRFAKV